jgi:ubiquinone/menaquinone biosynthesis C-methylase UbiE
MSEISRVTRSKAEARATYDAISKWYDALAGGAEAGLRRLGLQGLDVQPGETVLEIGFGTGQGILALARSVGASGKVCGIDISPGMHDLALARVKQAGLSGWVELRCGDAADLPFEADASDAVFMCFTLELFDTPEIPTVLEECRRVLRPGGRLCTVSMSSSERTSLALSLYDWVHRTFPRFADCRPIPARQFLETSGFGIRKMTNVLMWGLPVSVILSVKVP